jgi:hypothetical protein
VLTRIQIRLIRLVASSDAKSQLEELQHTFYAIGASMEEALLKNEDEDDTEQPSSSLSSAPATTYLVTMERTSTAKHLAAWSRGIPIVRPSFVEALVKTRRKPSDPFPKGSLHAPQLKTNFEYHFWSKTANPMLWRSCNQMVKAVSAATIAKRSAFLSILVRLAALIRVTTAPRQQPYVALRIRVLLFLPIRHEWPRPFPLRLPQKRSAFTKIAILLGFIRARHANNYQRWISESSSGLVPKPWPASALHSISISTLETRIS